MPRDINPTAIETGEKVPQTNTDYNRPPHYLCAIHPDEVGKALICATLGR